MATQREMLRLVYIAATKAGLAHAQALEVQRRFQEELDKLNQNSQVT
jgi:hypothetical protein